MATLFVSGVGAFVERNNDVKHLGHLLNPRSYNSITSLLSTGLPIAADNDCFQGLNRVQYIAMLRRIAPYADRFLWTTAPDVVANAAATRARWSLWRPVLHHYGVRAAYVAQDGSETIPPPWSELDCLFIGGSTRWKEGPYALRLMREAKDRGKWVHVGRVNTLRRRWLMGVFDFDSIDGSCFSKFPDKYIPWMLRTFPYKQHGMEDLLCEPTS